MRAAGHVASRLDSRPTRSGEPISKTTAELVSTRRFDRFLPWGRRSSVFLALYIGFCLGACRSMTVEARRRSIQMHHKYVDR